MKQRDHDSKKRIAFPIQLFAEGSAFAELPDEIHVVPTGKWKHPYFGEIEFAYTPPEWCFRRARKKITAGHYTFGEENVG
jgi:hypothetical protein